MVYKDQTFCTNHKNCKREGGCPSPYTEEVYQEALEWWGDQPGYPLFSLTTCRGPIEPEKEEEQE